jgi:hypothetical protein
MGASAAILYSLVVAGVRAIQRLSRKSTRSPRRPLELPSVVMETSGRP